MFPLKAARRIEHTPYITYGLIAVNALIFLWQTTLSPDQLYILYWKAGFVPCQVTGNLQGATSFLSAFTSMFLHGGWLHLIGNMAFLAAFGPAVEDYLGKRVYLLFYLMAGLAGSIFHMLFNWSVCIPAIGASGAIMGVMGGFLLLYPGTRITTLVFFMRIPVRTLNVPALYLLGTYFVLDLLNGIASLSVETATSGGIAVWAHIGGFFIGFLMAFIVMSFRPLPPVDPLAALNED